ncbi:MAG: tRNA preQ1(34) S-adenosylmethionine ribosyltransferase-isomerase QueA [Patescibacteria group bacterium]|nr:tRNA preQ1(34) S-adenosylmethionine ribosyltransferase-isomerase QueA [Patescibacteria group bacterium]
MKLSLFNYYLPKDFIAQKPVRPRDHSRLLVLNRQTGKIEHRHFYNIAEYLKPGDVLVLNNSKVFPARLIGRKPTGGKIEVFLLHQENSNTWSCLLGGKGRRVGLHITVGENGHSRLQENFESGQTFARLRGTITKHLPDGTWHIRFNHSGQKLQSLINRLGQAPTPPYIKRASNLTEYQTVYAQKTGSVAAPTAGFHFTKNLLNLLVKRLTIEYITLHVGYGTFQPVKSTEIEKHKMHPEFIEVDKATHQRLLQAKKSGRRIIAVGTTSVRALESLSQIPQSTNKPQPKTDPPRAEINLFIYPGYKFKMVDAMITNFHLPKSTLLMLVSAFAGRTKILKAYKTAIRNKYRFYSFGDSMLIS